MFKKRRKNRSEVRFGAIGMVEDLASVTLYKGDELIATIDLHRDGTVITYVKVKDSMRFTESKDFFKYLKKYL